VIVAIRYLYVCLPGESLRVPPKGAKGDPGSRGMSGLPGIDGTPGRRGPPGLFTELAVLMFTVAPFTHLYSPKKR